MSASRKRGRMADIGAAVRLLDGVPTTAPTENSPLSIRRQVIADFCRLVGARLAHAGNGAPTDHSRQSSGLSDNPDLTGAIESAAKPSSGGDDSSIPGAFSPMKLHVGAPEPPMHLSPRMRQTLALLLTGDSEKQIARTLQISQHTVHVYVKAVYRSFGVNSRAELLARFVSTGQRWTTGTSDEAAMRVG